MSQRVKVLTDLEMRERGSTLDGGGVVARVTVAAEGHWCEVAEEAAAVLFKLRPTAEADTALHRVLLEFDHETFQEGFLSAAREAFLARWNKLRAEAPPAP